MGIHLSTHENLLSTNLITSQLIHRQALSTCYDAIFDLSLDEQTNLLLISDDSRLRLFEINENNQYQLNEKTCSPTKRLLNEQVYDIIWSNIFERFLVLTSKRMILYDKDMNIVDLDLQLDKNSPPLWRMACWSIHLVVNLGLGSCLRYYQLQTCQSVEFIKSYSRTDLGYTNSDLLSTIILSPQSILGINVELANNRHIIDLFSLNNSNFIHLKRIDCNNPCPLDLLTSLRDYTWLCKSHWPSDDCLCLIESDGQVSKCSPVCIDGYILSLKISIHRSFIVLIRTANKLPKEGDANELNRIDEQEEPVIRGRKREVIGKLPGNLLLEIYQIKKNIE